MVSRITCIFHDFPDAEAKDLQEARNLLDRITKDANIREGTCSQFYKKVKNDFPEYKDYIDWLLDEKQKRMKFLDRSMRAQAHYDKKVFTSKNYEDPVYAMEVPQAAKAARTCKLSQSSKRYIEMPLKGTSKFL